MIYNTYHMKCTSSQQCIAMEQTAFSPPAIFYPRFPKIKRLLQNLSAKLLQLFHNILCSLRGFPGLLFRCHNYHTTIRPQDCFYVQDSEAVLWIFPSITPQLIPLQTCRVCVHQHLCDTLVKFLHAACSKDAPAPSRPPRASRHARIRQ